MTILIEGRQCVLMPMRNRYLRDHVRFLQNPAVTRFLRIDGRVTHRSQQEWLRAVRRSPQDEVVAIGLKDENTLRFVGVAHLHEINPRERTAGGGILIGDQRLWGHGIATEARLLHLKHAFEDLNLLRVFGRTASGNIGAQKLMERCGYQFQGIRSACRLVDGHYVDEYLYAVSRAEWRKAWEGHV